MTVNAYVTVCTYSACIMVLQKPFKTPQNSQKETADSDKQVAKGCAGSPENDGSSKHVEASVSLFSRGSEAKMTTLNYCI